MAQIPVAVAAVGVACLPFVAFVVEPKETVASFAIPVLVADSCYHQNFQIVGAHHFEIAD